MIKDADTYSASSFSSIVIGNFVEGRTGNIQVNIWIIGEVFQELSGSDGSAIPATDVL